LRGAFFRTLVARVPEPPSSLPQKTALISPPSLPGFWWSPLKFYIYGCFSLGAPFFFHPHCGLKLWAFYLFFRPGRPRRSFFVYPPWKFDFAAFFPPHFIFPPVPPQSSPPPGSPTYFCLYVHFHPPTSPPVDGFSPQSLARRPRYELGCGIVPLSSVSPNLIFSVWGSTIPGLAWYENFLILPLSKLQEVGSSSLGPFQACFENSSFFPLQEIWSPLSYSFNHQSFVLYISHLRRIAWTFPHALRPEVVPLLLITGATPPSLCFFFSGGPHRSPICFPWT